MPFSFVRSTSNSFFFLRTLCCRELTTASSAVSWSCETIFSTSGAVVFIDAWYYRSASWLGFIIPSPLSLTGNAKSSLSLGDAPWWSVIDSIKTSAMARSKGSGSVDLLYQGVFWENMSIGATSQKPKGCVAHSWLWHCKFCQLNQLPYPILQIATDVFFQIFSGAQGCHQMPLALRSDFNRSSFENYSSNVHLFRFGNKPTFLSLLGYRSTPD